MKALIFQTVGLALAIGLSSTTQAQQGTESDPGYHDNVVIVLDASGSMKQRMSGTRINKIDAAKSALKAVLQNVAPTTHIGLLVFSAKNLDDDWVYPLGPRDDAALLQAIDRPTPHKGTPLGEYIKKGADRLLSAREEQYGYGSYRLLIVTDGEANDEKLVERYTPEVLARGITMDVIGVDMENTHMLANLAHSYRRADDPDSLKVAIEEVFAELSADNADFSMEEAFDLLAPIPAETAAAALQALSTSGNEPIGKATSRTDSASGNAVARSSNSQHRSSQPSHTTRQVSVERHPSSFLKIAMVLFIALLVIGKKLLS